MKGIFTISLDFELHWGGFEKWRLGEAASGINPQGPDYRQYFLNTRNVIPELLRLFELYGVHVTWATVGMLFHQSKTELLANAPDLKPSYQEKALSAYHYIDTTGIGSDEEEDPFHYASSLIGMIQKTPHQELGTHTFAHYYCNEPGQTIDEFRADIRAAQRAAAKYGVTLRSLVFPRNQFNDQYLEVCWQEGITSVRSNPLDWFWHIESTQRESMWKRLNRGLDAYFPIGKKNTFRLESLNVRDGYPVCIPASRLLRPYNPKEFFLNDFKITRIQNEMTRAADKGEVYHLWWHPHNFGSFPAQSLEGLEQILKCYASLRDQGRMQSLHMQDLTSMLHR
jgi:peptidoglycan/xylan/chitin deacetylase (PgdA/CDA1 family)